MLHWGKEISLSSNYRDVRKIAVKVKFEIVIIWPTNLKPIGALISPPLSIGAQLYGHLKLLIAARKGKKSKKDFIFSLRSHLGIRDLSQRRPGTNQQYESSLIRSSHHGKSMSRRPSDYHSTDTIAIANLPDWTSSSRQQVVTGLSLIEMILPKTRHVQHSPGEVKTKQNNVAMVT